MPTPNPSCWAFQGLATFDGALEVRLFRDDGTHDWSSDTPFKWLENHPDDTIIVDDPEDYFPEQYWGKTGFKELNSLGEFAPVAFDFGMQDRQYFSGTINGSATGRIDLSSSGTSRLAWFFNDTHATYRVCILQINPDKSYPTNPVIWSGSVIYSRINKPQAFYSLKPGTTNSYNLHIWKLQATTVSDDLKAHTVQELLTGSGDFEVKTFPISGITQSDMVSTGRLAALAGFTTTAGAGIADNFSDINPLQNIDGTFRIAAYPDDPFVWELSSGALGFSNITTPKNHYGIKFGFNYIPYGKIVSKLSQFGTFTFSSSDTDNVCDIYGNYSYTRSGSTDEWAMSQVGDAHLIDALCINYNVRFGINPQQFIFGGFSFGVFSPVSNIDDLANAGVLNKVTVSSVTNATPAVFTCSSDHGLTVGEPCWVTNTGAGAIGGAWVVDTTPSLTTFTLKRADTGATVNGNTYFAGTNYLYYAGDNYYAWQQPCSYDRNTTLADLLQEIAIRFKCVLVWSFNQSGTHFGKPKLSLRQMGKSDGAAPNAIQAGIHSIAPEVRNLSFAKKAIKLKTRGVDQIIYCPLKPKSDNQCISVELSGMYKRWGQFKGFLPSDLKLDTNQDINHQWDSCYYFEEASDGGTNGNLTITPRGWSVGAFDCYNITSDPSLPSQFDKLILGSHPEEQQGSHQTKKGAWALSYEEFHGSIRYTNSDGSTTLKTTGGSKDATNTDPNNFSTLTQLGIIMANAFLRDNVEHVYNIQGCKDDSNEISGIFGRYKIQVRDEFGNNVYERINSMLVNLRTGLVEFSTLSCESDETIIDFKPIVIETGGIGSSIGGAALGGGFSGGASSSANDAVITDPINNARNKRAAQPNVELVDDMQAFGAQANVIDLSALVPAGQNNDVVSEDGHGVGYTSQILENASGAYSVTGFTGGVEDKWLRVWNNTSYTCTVKHQTGSSSANQITTPDGTNQTVPAGGYCEFEYRGTKWNLVNIYPDTSADVNDVVTNPSTDQIIQSTVTNKVPLWVEKQTSQSVELVKVTDSNGTTYFFDVNSTGQTEVYKQLNIIGTTTPIGLDTGSGTSVGTNGQALTSGGGAAVPVWRGTVLLAPLSANGNTIQVVNNGDRNLILQVKSGQTANLFELKDSGGTRIGTIDTVGKYSINAINKNAFLYVAGDVAFEEVAYAIGNAGNYNNLNLWGGAYNTSMVVVTNGGIGGATTITGVANNNVSGIILDIYNQCGQTLQFNHLDANSSAGNQFSNFGAANQVVVNGDHIGYQWSTTIGCWLQRVHA